MQHRGTIRLETDRLVLRQHVLEDAEVMFKNWVTEKRSYKVFKLATT